ncbi:heme-dependent oxidative N-demethylase family protein [Brevibacillus sp. H7]|uniref:heme-dependent oxidative N-demethylase family protein n=1 Tax=Brevibacillus sp. H7 TaxID=3349138 RepID=UPI00382E16B0
MNDLLHRFPFPFTNDVYRYSNNSIPLEHPVCFEITPEYPQEIERKRQLLNEYHNRCYQSLPHTREAQWEIVELVLDQMALYHPESFQVDKQEGDCLFHNRLTGETQRFTIGDDSSLPCEPLDFIGRHLQEDCILMMQRDGDLFLDAGQLCFPANWSLQFNTGMNFLQIHSPIPGFNDQGLADRIRAFLMRIEAGQPWIRRNWSLNAGRRLDTSLETFHLWGPDRKKVTPENAGEFVHLRVEVQKLFRLPRSNGLLFTIHTHLISLEELSRNRAWTEQLYRVLCELPDFIADYKGILLYKEATLSYLENILAREAL